MLKLSQGYGACAPAALAAGTSKLGSRSTWCCTQYRRRLSVKVFSRNFQCILKGLARDDFETPRPKILTGWREKVDSLYGVDLLHSDVARENKVAGPMTESILGYPPK